MRRVFVAIVLRPLFVFGVMSAFAYGGEPNLGQNNLPLIIGDQRVVIVMFDGLGTDYVARSEMPVLKGMMAKGFSKTVRAVMPTVTNVNNASICCGAWPDEHGITGNSFFDEAKGRPEYMESSEYLRLPTLFERAARQGVKSALLTAKKKTIALLSRGTELSVAAESPPSLMEERIGPAPRFIVAKSTTGCGKPLSTC